MPRELSDSDCQSRRNALSPLIESVFRPVSRIILASLVLLSVVWTASAQRKKKTKNPEDLPTQQLEVLPDPPLFSTLETARLTYQMAPLTSKGLLSQQTRDAIRALIRNARGAQIAHLRAFVAGTGDLRRIQNIVSEEFSEKHLTLPSISVIQIGALPVEGAQVLLEAAMQDKRPVNPKGLVLLSGQQVVAEGKVDNPLQPVLPLFEKSLANLATAATGAGVTPASMLRVTCLVSSLADHAAQSQALSRAFPGVPATIVQLQRGPSTSVVECEGVARLSQEPSSLVERVNPPGLTSSPNYSQAVRIKAAKLVMTGSQIAFGLRPEDAKLAFTRLGRVLESAKTSWRDVVFTSYYPLSNQALELLRATRFDYLDRSQPPASTAILFEGLPSLEASFAIEVVAAIN